MKYSPLLGVQTLAIVTILSSSCLLAVDFRGKKLLGRAFIMVLLVAAAAILIRLPVTSPGFYGLEYEDSYLYVSAARFIALHGHIPPEPPLSAYLITSCAVGSLAACQKRAAFSGHYLGYPALLAMIVSLIGYTRDIGYDVALVANVLNILLIYLLVASTNNNQTLAVLSAAILGLTPAFVVYGTSSLSEPFSALLVTLSLYVYCHIRDLDARRARTLSVVAAVVLAATLLYAVLVKRENLVLPVAFTFDMAISLLLSRGRKTNAIFQMLGSVAACAVVMILAVWNLGIIQTAHSEAHEFGSFPFSLSYANRLLPMLLEALTKWGWFLGAWIPLILALTVDLRKSHLLRISLMTLFGYLILYMNHVRGFYFLQGDVSPVDWLRYLCNVSGLISIAVAFGFVQVWTLARRAVRGTLPTTIMRGAGLIALGGLMAISAMCSSALRADLAGEEEAFRIAPALRVEKFALSADRGNLTS